MTEDRRTAYWSRPTPQAEAEYPPLDFTVCWRNGCSEPVAAVQDVRWRGVYCVGCQKRMAKSVEREDG